jgi:hypothetical protein
MQVLESTKGKAWKEDIGLRKVRVIKQHYWRSRGRACFLLGDFACLSQKLQS